MPIPARQTLPALGQYLLTMMLISSCATATTGSPANSPDKPAFNWAGLSHDERKTHMRDAVLPTMEPLFIGHDGQRFASFGCKTCHGRNAQQRDYAMPSPDLPTLYPSGAKEQIETLESHREISTFMFQSVTPTMRELLRLPPYDSKTGEGFSCFYCHPRGEPEST